MRVAALAVWEASYSITLHEMGRGWALVFHSLLPERQSNLTRSYPVLILFCDSLLGLGPLLYFGDNPIANVLHVTAGLILTR